MCLLKKISISFVFVIVANIAFAGNNGKNPTGNKDTSTNIKSNIVIFKLINNTHPANSNASSGTLKKAGKVARTSTSNITTNRKLSFNEG